MRKPERDHRLDAGVNAARRRLGRLVHAPALAEASDIDKLFLLAMSADHGASQMRDIQARLGVDVRAGRQTLWAESPKS